MKKSRFNLSNILRKKKFTTEQKDLMSICIEKEIFILRVNDNNDVDKNILKWIDD